MREAVLLSLSYVKSHLDDIASFAGRPAKNLCDGKHDIRLHAPLNWEQWDIFILPGGATAVALVSLAFNKTPKASAGVLGFLNCDGRIIPVNELDCGVVELSVKQGLRSLVVSHKTTVTDTVAERCGEIGFEIHRVATFVEALPYLFE